MNIGISTLVSPKQVTGVGKYILNLIEYLQEIDSSNNYFIFVNKEFDKLIEIRNRNFNKVLVNIPHVPRLAMRPAYFFWQNTLALKYYRKYKLDVFHLPNAMPLKNTKVVNYVVTIHDVAECVSVPRFSAIRQKFRIWATKSSAKNAKQFLTVSNFSKSEIQKVLSLGDNEITVTYPGLTLRIEDSLNNEKAEGKFFLHVGGGNKNKNVKMLIEAFLGMNYPKEVKLKFVGTPRPAIASSKRTKEWKKKNIYFHDYIEESQLVDLYNNAYALIYPSLYEGFGLPITEAMACGTPVITSNITSMLEVGGDAVHYVDPYSVDSIKEGMEKLLNDEDYRQSLIHKGLKRYKMFSWEETARKTIEVYEKAALKK